MLGQIFVQIYTDPACSKMHAHFADEYMAADLRMPMATATTRVAIAAVA